MCLHYSTRLKHISVPGMLQGKMTEETVLTTSHLSVAMTTEPDDVTLTESGNTMTSSSWRGADFIFQCAVVSIGIIGAAANGLVLYAMVASKHHKKQLLIFNQNVFDLCSCLFLVITYTLKLCDIYLTGTPGYWLCMMLLSENFLWVALSGSAINLLSVAVERYLKVVHPALGKKLLRKWVLYAVIALTWIGSAIHNTAVVFTTSRVIDGVCYVNMFWESQTAVTIYGVWHFVSFFVIVLIGSIFCYGRILVVIRRKARVMAAHSNRGNGSSSAEAQSHRVQANVVKTTILVCSLYVVTCLPELLFYLLVNLGVNLPLSGSAYYTLVYVVTFFIFVYVCANPLIYAIKFDPVKRVLLSLIPCKKTSVQSAENIEMNLARIASSRTSQTKNDVC